jgi:GTP-binding protein
VISVRTADFLLTATALADCPREPIPEIAFVGRSNVGKSSMINTLVNRRKLVRVSNTPGRTRTLNFFDVTLDGKGRTTKLRLCDLPGYGFARVSKAERESWQEMIQGYLTGRPQLKVVVAIVDAEIGPTPDDVQMLDFLQDAPPSILVAATKLDRVPKAKRKPAVLAVAKALELPPTAVHGFSATEKIGVQEVWSALLDGAASPRR